MDYVRNPGVNSTDQHTPNSFKVFPTQMSVFSGGGWFVHAVTYASERMSPALAEPISKKNLARGVDLTGDEQYLCLVQRIDIRFYQVLDALLFGWLLRSTVALQVWLSASKLGRRGWILTRSAATLVGWAWGGCSGCGGWS